MTAVLGYRKVPSLRLQHERLQVKYHILIHLQMLACALRCCSVRFMRARYHLLLRNGVLAQVRISQHRGVRRRLTRAPGNVTCCFPFNAMFTCIRYAHYTLCMPLQLASGLLSCIVRTSLHCVPRCRSSRLKFVCESCKSHPHWGPELSTWLALK
jgi:hypothetical protein